MKNLSKRVVAGLVFGAFAVVGVAIVIAFTEPLSGPTGFDEPQNTQDKGDLFAYGRGWSPNSSGVDGITAITKTACDNAANWYWFEDGNGDGDQLDEEDGICVKVTTVTSNSWNGDDWASERDNTYIADYACTGNYPDGIVATYSGIDSSGNADTNWDNGDCALCQADCYDGKKDLPSQGGYTTPNEDAAGHHGPITPEVLKNWKGTRLPTANDFFGFCGYKAGSDGHNTDCFSSRVYGTYGGQMGRTDECLDTAGVGGWEWLSEQHYYHGARVGGANACSNFAYANVPNGYRFRAVFRP